MSYVAVAADARFRFRLAMYAKANRLNRWIAMLVGSGTTLNVISSPDASFPELLSLSRKNLIWCGACIRGHRTTKLFQRLGSMQEGTGKSHLIRVDNCPEFISKSLDW
ncbi:MAG: hypothetical protein FJ308_14350 [Planctomycetes bacterium]|nr:hypothetical protein [Planctomycetota bacterium]